ncbi:MAG: redoxin domain-containing protein [Chloroflexi bacterium]|nr:redoxin domain-containing protein [Chloroflexota bacterium]
MVFRSAILFLSALLVLSVGCGSDRPQTGDQTAVGDRLETPAETATGGSEPTPEPSPTQKVEKTSRFRAAPEITGGSGWINSEPLTISGLNAQRRVVLIDFWTYTCVNCIRTLPYLKMWHQKYAERGLTIIGVHSPEFEFEKLPVNVRSAVDRYGLKYAIVQDNRMETWDAFDNRYWPAKYLIDVQGGIRFQHFGEGEYEKTEKEIRAALVEAGWNVGDIPEGGLIEPEQDPKAYTVTRELYGGYDRNFSPFGVYAAQDAYYAAPDHTVFYDDNQPHAHNKWYLQGLWRNEAESIVHARQTNDHEDYIALKFAARSVNVVIEPDYQAPFDVLIEMNGRWLKPEEAGGDVTFDEQGRSLIKVNQPRLYAIVELPEFGIHELKLRSNSDAFSMFAFTFGIYTDGA